MMDSETIVRLKAVVNKLIGQMDPSLHEEEGGFIVRKGDEFRQVKVPNANSGDPVAVALYTADQVAFGELVVAPYLLQGWKLFASFHTHPAGCSTNPSNIDLEHLFRGFKINYIYSPSRFALSGYVACEKGWYPVHYTERKPRDEVNFFDVIADYAK